MNNKPRVLLTASYGPNDLAWGEDMYDLMSSRLSRGHGPFQMHNHMHYFALYLIAENITNPATVLENPHWDEFDKELDEGYDVVSFQLKSLHTDKIARMMKRVREKCPDTKIVVGGYGVGALDHDVPGDVNGDADYIRQNADYMCREEGVRFMRRLLDDGPVDREIEQYNLPCCGISLSGSGSAHAKAGTILVALGCPNACDFCNTSATFYHKKIYVAEPEQVYRYMKNYQKRLNNKNIFTLLFDEDFFINPEYVRELGRLLRSDKDTWGIKYFTFGGVRSLSQFEVEELRDCGLGAVWIGVESFMCGPDRADDIYKKRKGHDIKKLFKDLHKNGIQTTGSLILGLDYHTKENLKEDIDQFVALKPMMYQISPLTPCPGTPLYDRMSEEERIKDNYQWKDVHLWKDDVFEFTNFEASEIKDFYDYAHEQLRDINGPPAMQLMESSLDLHRTMVEQTREKTDEFLDYQKERARMRAGGVSSYLSAVQKHHTSEKVRARARMLEKRFHDEVGDKPLISKIASTYLDRLIKKNKKTKRPAPISDPPPRWSYYNTFDDRVWVRKGRSAKNPVPYKDKNGLISIARFIRG